MSRQAPARPLVIKRYGNIDLANGMSVVGGVDGKILVIARYRRHVRRKLFHQDEPLIDRLAWQHETIEKLRLLASGRRQPDTTLAEDIDAYLDSLTGSRHTHAETWLTYWRDWYGYLKRADLTLGQVQAFFQHVTPRSNPKANFSASSKNKLRTYLINVWRFHDGRRHECPAQEISVFPEPAGEPRELLPSDIQKILSHMDDSPNRARLGLIFVTGCRPAELASLTAESFALDEDVPHVRFLTAKGGANRALPLPPIGVQYARDFVRHEAWRVTNNLPRDMRRAAKRAGLDVFAGGAHPGGRRKVRISPYALRHTYAMNLRRSGAGVEDIADALGHKSLDTTRRYAQTIPERQVAVVGKMWERTGLV